MTKKFKLTKGFTIIEMLLYMGLLAIFLVVVTDILLGAIDVQLESSATSSVATDGRYMINRLSYDISRSQTIVTPSAPGVATSELELVINGQAYRYSLNGSQLELTSPLGTHQLNSGLTDVSGVQFLRLSNPGGKPTISVDITVTSKTVRAKGPEMRVFQTTVGGR